MTNAKVTWLTSGVNHHCYLQPVTLWIWNNLPECSSALFLILRCACFWSQAGKNSLPVHKDTWGGCPYSIIYCNKKFKQQQKWTILIQKCYKTIGIYGIDIYWLNQIRSMWKKGMSEYVRRKPCFWRIQIRVPVRRIRLILISFMQFHYATPWSYSHWVWSLLLSHWVPGAFLSPLP